MNFLRDFLNDMPPADRFVFLFGVCCALVIAVLFGIHVYRREPLQLDGPALQPISRVLTPAPVVTSRQP